MNKLNDKMILKVTDTFDEAAKLYYYNSINEELDNTRVTNYYKETGRLNYYEALLKVISYFLEIDDITSSHLDDDVIIKIQNLFDSLIDEIEKDGLNNEELRKALLLLDIKGFKNLNYSLDIITPDNVGLIIAKIVEAIFGEKKKNILDFNAGVGNLLFTILNNIEGDFSAIAIDNHALMVRVLEAKANLLQSELTVIHQDALDILPHDIDLVVSDIACYDYNNDSFHSPLYDEGVRYFPYLAIEHYLEIPHECTYIYVIDSDFFQKEKNELMKKLIDEKATIKAFVVLPFEMFQNESTTKSLLILENTPCSHSQSDIYMLPSLKKKDPFFKVLGDLLEKIKKN